MKHTRAAPAQLFLSSQYSLLALSLHLELSCLTAATCPCSLLQSSGPDICSTLLLPLARPRGRGRLIIFRIPTVFHASPRPIDMCLPLLLQSA